MTSFLGWSLGNLLLLHWNDLTCCVYWKSLADILAGDKWCLSIHEYTEVQTHVLIYIITKETYLCAINTVYQPRMENTSIEAVTENF